MVLFWAWITRRSRWMTAVLAAVPALVILEIAIPDERLRLLSIGIVIAVAFATTAWIALPRRPAGTASPHPPFGHLLPRGKAQTDHSHSLGQPSRGATVDVIASSSDDSPEFWGITVDTGWATFIALGISATFLLRWIPLAGVEWKKEWIVLAGVALLLALTKERTPMALALALIIGLVTPLHPRRMVLYPALVAVAQAVVPSPVAGALVFVSPAAVVPDTSPARLSSARPAPPLAR